MGIKVVSKGWDDEIKSPEVDTGSPGQTVTARTSGRRVLGSKMELIWERLLSYPWVAFYPAKGLNSCVAKKEAGPQSPERVYLSLTFFKTSFQI